MCGIYFYISKQQVPKGFKNIKHRGPDESVVRTFNLDDYKVKLGFHRLAIMDPTHNGMQPFEHDDIFCLINGEIYNYLELKKEIEYNTDYKFQSGSDCEVLLPLFELIHYDVGKLCKKLDGEYTFIILDTKTQKIYMGTDEISVRPLFYYFDEDTFVAGSEIKSFYQPYMKGNIKRLPAGNHLTYDIKTKSLKLGSHMDWYPTRVEKNYEETRDEVFKLLRQSMRMKLMMDREAAFLLSGGLDSSLVCQEATLELRKKDPNYRIRTFTIGLTKKENIKEGRIIPGVELPSDIVASRLVAKSINSIHEELWFSLEEAYNSIEKVVWHAESWDQTSIRASVPMYLGVNEIKKRYPNIAVIFSGELSDELLQGYLYNHECPNPEEGRKDTIRLLSNICYFDGLRADRMVSSASCELRLIFFNKDLLQFILSSNPEYFTPKYSINKVGKPIEKYILRDAIDISVDKLLPQEVIWRTKEALSDATSHKSEWKEYIKERLLFNPINDGISIIDNEEKLYRYYFDKYYSGAEELIPYKWMPNWIIANDPSATVLQVHKELVK